jgi:hypothetical protein
LLLVDEENWGPRPQQMLKFWADLSGYHEFVKDKWRSFQVTGWGGYVLKEKLKLIKRSLQIWHQTHTQNLDGRIRDLQDRISTQDAKREEYDLDLEEVEELHSLSDNLHSLSRINNNIHWQKSRLLWLKEGDANSKFFHSIMPSRRRAYTIVSLSVNGSTVEGVDGIRGTVFSHFASHFRSVVAERPSIDNLNFHTLHVGQRGDLTKLFIIEEVKQEVWDSDSYKSPRSDDINLGFIKDFWSEMRDDVMRFIS